MKTYIKKIVFGGMVYLILAFLMGAIPAIAILLRAELIDSAAARVSGGAGTFVLLLVLYCAIYLLERVLQALSLRLSERHKIQQTGRLDRMRTEKAARTAFGVAESARFHVLLRLAAKAPEADSSLYQSMGDIVRTGTRMVLSLVTIVFVDRWTALGMLVLLTAGVFLNSRLAKTTEGFWSNYIETMRRTNYLSSLLMQREFAAERKLFSYDAAIESRYEAEFEKAKRQNAKSGKRRLTAELILQLTFAIYSVAVVLLLFRPFMAQEITIGLFTSTFYAAIGLLQVSRQLYAGVYAATESVKQLGSFFSFLAIPEESATGVFTDRSVDRIAFEQVTFTYPGAADPVIKGLNLSLEGGKHYAIVGENGCGKTTLVKLLLGLYSPDSGAVRVNDQKVDELALEERRKLFAAVFQDFYNYPLTIRETVSLCAPQTATDEQIRDLFEKLEFHPAAVAGERGYDSDLMLVKGDGRELSGGEWQKLAVARCMLSSAPIVVLDEPNSALDPVSEAAVYGAYRKLLAQRTTIFISHRLGSVRMADEIIVLKDGHILAKAPHDELMASCGYYAELYQTQKEMYDEKEQ